MRPFKILLSFIGFLLAISPAVSFAAQKLDISPMLIGGGAVLATIVMAKYCIDYAPGAYSNGVQKEAWVDYIIKRFWKDNLFLKFVHNESNKVLAGRVVHIPNPGAKPTVRKNRSEFPAVAVRRVDTDITYALDEYSVDPVHVHNLEKIELSYDALNEAYGDQLGVVSETIADDMIIKWLTGVTGNGIYKTTGGATASTVAGTTGNRKLAIHTDLRKANLRMNLMNVPKVNRYGLLEDNMADQIFESLSETQYRNFTQYADATTGVLGRLYNFDLMTRSSVAVASNADAILALDAVPAATASAASMLWQKDCLTLALGEVKVFDDTDNPLYYGDIISSAQRAGGRRKRADNAGVIAYIQDTAA